MDKLAGCVDCDVCAIADDWDMDFRVVPCFGF